MASLSARRYSSSVANPQSKSNPQLRTEAVSAFREARATLTALRLGKGCFSILTSDQREAAIAQLMGVPTPAERARIETEAAAQRHDASRTPSARRTSPVAASQRRNIEANRPNNCIADRGYAYR